MSKKLCIHAHFYQPDRVDPFSGAIADDVDVLNKTKRKFHNWNELINYQCYSPNAKLKNFSLISFDLVRPLAEWLCHHDTETYHRIMQSIHESLERDRVAPVMASSWDHVILPLMNDVDLLLEISWGLADFRKRFGVEARAFWLPEAAVSYRVLEVLARKGVRLIILSPHQAQSAVDPTKFYRVNVGDNHIDVAFFHKEFSDRLSFDNVGMQNADEFAKSALHYVPNEDGFLLGATDGERYGHHFKDGPQFLRQFLTVSAKTAGFELASLPLLHMKTHDLLEARIVDLSSWSCLCGGLARWQGDCACALDYTDNNKRVDGSWKARLMFAIRQLSDQLWGYSNQFFGRVLRDSLDACDDFVNVVLHNKTESEFLAQHALQSLDNHNTRKLFLLLHMQRYRLASFTSCATFFWNLDRPEPRIVINQAKKALSILGLIQEHALMYRLELLFVDELSKALDYKSGVSGKDLYEESGSLSREAI
jgi:hypothetical protein